MSVHHMLTEPEAWRLIAERFVEADWWDLDVGICPEITRLRCVRHRISEATAQQMHARLQAYLIEDGHYMTGHSDDRIAFPRWRRCTFWSKAYITRYREARALICLWLALEAEATP